MREKKKKKEIERICRKCSGSLAKHGFQIGLLLVLYVCHVLHPQRVSNNHCESQPPGSLSEISVKWPKDPYLWNDLYGLTLSKT